MTSFFLDTLRDQYKRLCALHEIQYVENDVIKTRNFPINDFAVKLKMASSRVMVDESFKGEMARHLKYLNEATSYDINIDNLIDEKTRVTFVRGIAGIGKSVFAKQIVFGWATGTMYENFEVCLFFECRELNNYRHNEGEGFNSKEMLHEFIKIKLRCLNIKGEKNMLIVIDGVDELFDIGDKNSLIFQFLDISKSYGEAKIIMTGRPHVESVLNKRGITIGRYKVVEIMGLGEEEIKEYIAKFTTCIEGERSSEYRNSVNQTIEASSDFRPILCVPQFLNAICCISILTGGEGIGNETELYCGTLYLLFKQHVFEREMHDEYRSIYHNIFTSYRQLILVVSEISFKLYSKNQIIFKKEDFQPLFDRVRGDKSIKPIAKGFFDGLFADKTDNKDEKFMYRHLSIMEFFSAIHVCTVKDPNDVIKRLLDNESYEIVRYACGLYGGVFQDGIGNELYECVMDDKATADSGDENKKEERAESFLKLALKVLSKSNGEADSKFLKSIDFIVQFFPRQFNRPSFVKSVLFQLKSIGDISIRPDAAEQRLLLRFFDIIKANAVDENSIKEVLENTEIRLSGKFDKELLTVMKYFGKDVSIEISGKNFNIDHEMMKLITDNVIYFSSLWFSDFKFNGPYFKTKLPEHYSKLKHLLLQNCEFSNESFKMFSQCVAVLSERVELWDCNGIICEMWEIFGREIDDARRHKGLKLKELVVWRTAFDESNWAGAVRVFVKLERIRIWNCGICEEWWRILANEVEKRANDGTLKLKKLESKGKSGINENIRQSVRRISNQIFHFGLLLSTIDCKRWNNLQFFESFLPQYSQLCLSWITFKSGISVPTNISFIYETLSLINHIC